MAMSARAPRMPRRFLIGFVSCAISALDDVLEDQYPDGHEYHIKTQKQPEPGERLAEFADAQNGFHAADGRENDRNHQWKQNQRQQKLARAGAQGNRRHDRAEATKTDGT